MKAHSTLRDLQSMGIMKEKSELRSWDNLQQHHVAPFMAEMKKRGHDGVIMKTDNEDLPNNIAEVVAFNPNTIKHKDAEVFDPNDPRIRRDDGGRVTDTDEFRNWFGNSVTHTNGDPHVLYTGTSKDKDFTSHNVGRHGAWFTRDPEAASQYAEQNDSQGYKREGFKLTPTNTASRVIPAYVKAENPYTGELPEEHLRDNYKAAQSAWFDTLRAKGHDAWIPASQNGNLVVALKEPQQIKSIFNSGKFDPNQKHMNKAGGGEVSRKLNEHGFYSKALEAARNMQQAKGTPEQFMAQLKNTKGVKQAEIDSIGMPKGDKITKDDFVRHIAQNLPRLGMTQYGENPSFLSPEDQKFLRYATNNKQLTPEEEGTRQKLAQRRMSNIGHSTDDEGNSETNYQDHITGGGKNYRERLIKLTGNKQYQSSHWEPANVLAHVRMQDRTGPSGEKLLHVEEIQSDWGQQGRKKGFYDPKNPYEVSNRKTGEVMSKHPSYNSLINSVPEEQNYQDFDYLNAATRKAPIAPFVQNTQHWTDLAMKQILRDAALGDYDGVVFTPGQAQADRYGQADASGMKDYYDNIVPKSAMNLVQQHDPSTQTQSMNINGEYDALHIPLSDTAKSSIEKNGFQMFKRGGMVDKAVAATRRFTKDGIGATMSLKPRGK
jgi:hypothetical protein